MTNRNFIDSVTLPRVEMSSENYKNPKKRRKAATGERSVQTDNETCNDILCPAEEEYKKPITDR